MSFASAVRCAALISMPTSFIIVKVHLYIYIISNQIITCRLHRQQKCCLYGSNNSYESERSRQDSPCFLRYQESVAAFHLERQQERRRENQVGKPEGTLSDLVWR